MFRKWRWDYQKKTKNVDAAYVRFLRSLLRITLRKRDSERVFQAKNVKYLLQTENTVKWVEEKVD
jgi:hypothetical protein